MIEFYKYLYAGGSAPRTPYKFQKYIPEIERPNKCIQLSSCPANFTPAKYTNMCLANRRKIHKIKRPCNMCMPSEQ